MTEIGFFVRFFYQELRKAGREGTLCEEPAPAFMTWLRWHTRPRLQFFLISRFPDSFRALQLARKCPGEPIFGARFVSACNQ
jgi:hypothetical protein